MSATVDKTARAGRFAAIALTAGCAVLSTGCSSATKGAGQHSRPGAATGSQSVTATPSPDLATTKIGDPRTADMCANLDLSQLPNVFQGRLDDRANPTACAVNVSVAGLRSIDVHVETQRPEEASASEHGNSVQADEVNGLRLVTYVSGGICNRDVLAGGVAISLWSARGPLQADKGCLVTNSVALLVADEISAHHVAHRRYAPGSLTGRNLCDSLDPAVVAHVPGGAPLTVVPYDYGTACSANAEPGLYLDLEISLNPPSFTYETVRAGTHTVFELPYGTPGRAGAQPTAGCQEKSPQQPVPGTRLRETLKLTAELPVAKLHAPNTHSRVCVLARAAAAGVLDRLRLR
jgi:hypothetical protein